MLALYKHKNLPSLAFGEEVKTLLTAHSSHKNGNRDIVELALRLAFYTFMWAALAAQTAESSDHPAHVKTHEMWETMTQSFEEIFESKHASDHLKDTVSLIFPCVCCSSILIAIVKGV